MTMDEIQQVTELTERCHKAEAERDALAAHVERMNHLIFSTFAAIEDGDVNAIPYDEARELHNDSPDTSLDKLKAEWQAKALDEAAYEAERRHGYMLGKISPLELRQMAAEKRRQAEKQQP